MRMNLDYDSTFYTVNSLARNKFESTVVIEAVDPTEGDRKRMSCSYRAITPKVDMSLAIEVFVREIISDQQ